MRPSAPAGRSVRSISIVAASPMEMFTVVTVACMPIENATSVAVDAVAWRKYASEELLRADAARRGDERREAADHDDDDRRGDRRRDAEGGQQEVGGTDAAGPGRELEGHDLGRVPPGRGEDRGPGLEVDPDPSAASARGGGRRRAARATAPPRGEERM